MTRRRSFTTHGYALVEILAAMAIVVLIGTMAFLAFGNQDQRRLDAEAAQAALLLQTARLRALEEGRSIEIVVSARERVLDAGGEQIRFADAVRIQPERANILLEPSGNSDGLQLILSRNEARKAVTLDWLTGRVVVE